MGEQVTINARGEYFRFEVAPRLKFVLLIPDMEVLTKHARHMLPLTIGHREAVIS